MSSFEEREQELRDKACRVEVLAHIYDIVEKDMKWEACTWHDKDEEHDELWFTEPEETDDWKYPKYVVYQEMLREIEKLANK